MNGEEDYFIRNFYIDTVNTNIKLKQKLTGDVGCVVWDASIVLAKYLEELYKQNPEYFRNLNIIELGSGVGCVGLTATCLGANVLLTDLPEILPLLKTNVALNKSLLHKKGGSAQVSRLPWGEKLETKLEPDLVLLSDCIYYKESIEPLMKTLKMLSGPKTTVILSQEIRDSEKQKDCWNYFLKHIKQYFSHHFVPLESQNTQFRSPDIVLMKLLPL